MTYYNVPDVGYQHDQYGWCAAYRDDEEVKANGAAYARWRAICYVGYGHVSIDSIYFQTEEDCVQFIATDILTQSWHPLQSLRYGEETS